MPYYTYHAPICYLNTIKDHFYFGFIRGRVLSNVQGILTGQDLKLIRILEIQTFEELFRDSTAEIILEAVFLTEKKITSNTLLDWAGVTLIIISMKEQEAEVKKDFVNPIDKDKIAENPHLLPYAHTVGGAVIKPIDKGRVKGLSVTAMYEQTNVQLDQIREQVELLARQAEKIHKRVEVSERIYQSEMNFKPLINYTYHLYENKKGENILSMIGPDEWGRSKPYTFIATVKLLADHTWEVQG